MKGVHPEKLTPEQIQEIYDLLYKIYTFTCVTTCFPPHSCDQHGALSFQNDMVIIKEQYALPKVGIRDLRDPRYQGIRTSYGHGNNKTDGTKKSIPHPDLRAIPRVPQVQLIRNGTTHDHEGRVQAKLKHPHHRTFHANPVSDEDGAEAVTPFYRGAIVA